MKTFVKTAAQGEVYITRIGDVPATKAARDKFLEGTKPLQLEGGRFVIGHSETGHHHVLGRNEGVAIGVKEKVSDGIDVFRAILDNPNSLDHLREHDTHEPIALEPGSYEIRTAREYDAFAEEVRRSAD